MLTAIMYAMTEEMNCYIYTYNGIKTQWLADSVKAELVLNDEVLDTMSDRSVLNYCDIIYNASKR